MPRQISSGDALIAEYNCPVKNKYQDAWSHYNYLAYVLAGRKIWHTPNGSYDLREGSCVFVRKGACIVEQFLDTTFCIIFVFLPDDFICDVLKTRNSPIAKPNSNYEPVIPVNRDRTLDTFFSSMTLLFDRQQSPDRSLIELKFRELVLIIADDTRNTELLSYFNTLMCKPQSVSLCQVMEDNFCYNLKLEEFARLSNRSLSAFKRDFQKQFNTTPGKWLLEKRLNYAMHLISNEGKTVSEAGFESGFENISHFSRAFKNHFGVAPASMKMRIAV